MENKHDLIRLSGVQKEYGRGSARVLALRDVDMRVESGEFVAIMGPSGSGKSTLMNILGCLDRSHRGSYALGGVDTKTLSPGALAHLRNRTIGFVFQSFNLLPHLSARENIELPMVYAGIPAQVRRSRVNALLERLELIDRAGHPPSALSGGQKQRVAIGRALANEAPLLLADEPTGSLDSRTGASILRLLQQLNADGRTILLITHAREVADGAKRVLTLKDGLLA